jgi:hypothetical protein
MITGATELCLILFSLVLVVCIHSRIRHLYVVEHGSMLFDDALLIVALNGIYVFCTFSLIASANLVEHVESRHDAVVVTISGLTLVVNILSIIESICSSSPYH